MRSPPLSVFFTALPTMLSRRSLSPSSISFPSRRRGPIAPGEMWGADRGGELQVFADRQVLIESVVLRDVTDVTLERVEILIKRLAIEQDLATRGLKLARRAPACRVLLPEPLAPITQTSSPRLRAKLMPSSRNLAVAENGD